MTRMNSISLRILVGFALLGAVTGCKKIVGPDDEVDPPAPAPQQATGADFRMVGDGLDYVIYVDGYARGRLDGDGDRLSVDLSPGQHHWRVRNMKYGVYSQYVTFELGSNQRRVWALGSGDNDLIWQAKSASAPSGTFSLERDPID